MSNQTASRRVDFGDRVTGRVLDEDFHATRPPQYATGTVHRMFPKAPRVVGITTTTGDEPLVRLAAGVTT
jgi:hypothetical protein